jgi:aryl carrier-like protein
MPLKDRLHELTPEQRELFELFLKKERLSLEAESHYRAPSGAAERALADIWLELLGVEPGVDDNYFALGGDSITIIRMISRARSQGIALRASWVFSHPTIAELASLSQAEQAAALPPARDPDWQEQATRALEGDPDRGKFLDTRSVRPVNAYPMTSLQQGILYHALDAASEGAYVVQWRFRLKGQFDMARFRNAWRLLIERHEALRTIFQWTGVEEPMQVIVERADSAITEEDAASGARLATEAAIFDEERRTPFDLSKAPLMRIRFVRIAEDEWLSFWTHHHLILDGWSQQILLEELFAAYRGAKLAPAPVGVFKDHIYRQRAQETSSAIEFWRREFDGYQPAPSRPVRRHGCLQAILTRPVAGTGRLRELLKHHAVTLSALYQALWSVALAEITERLDVAFGVTTSGRTSGAPSIERAVGLFINTLPFRITVDPSLPFAIFLKMVQERQARLVEYEWCGLNSVQRWIEWDLQTPLVDSVYVYEKFPLDFAGLERQEGLAVQDIETTTHEHYPLVFIVQDQEDTTTLTLKHAAPDEETARRLDRLLDRIAAVPARLASSPELSVGNLLII